MQAALHAMLNCKPIQNLFKISIQYQKGFFKWWRKGDDNGNLTLRDDSKLLAWKDHYPRLLNTEFPWEKNFLNNTLLVGLLYAP